MSGLDSRFARRVCGLAVLALGVVLLGLTAVAPALADIGPKPKMTFAFEYDGDPIEILSGQLIECDDSLCSAGKPLEPLGPQRFWCDAGACQSMAYGYAEYHKLVIEFADRTRESNVFSKGAFSASYTVTVLDDSLLVEEKRTAGVGRFTCASAALPLFAVGLVLLRPRKT